MLSSIMIKINLTLKKKNNKNHFKIKLISLFKVIKNKNKIIVWTNFAE